MECTEKEKDGRTRNHDNEHRRSKPLQWTTSERKESPNTWRPVPHEFSAEEGFTMWIQSDSPEVVRLPNAENSLVTLSVLHKKMSQVGIDAQAVDYQGGWKETGF